MSSSSKPTMRDIAATVGVSAATVSMALRNDERISEAMRKRVNLAAIRLGYRPDPLVSALMAQRRGRSDDTARGTLGVISLWPDAARAWQTNPFYAPYREGVRDRAATLGYRLEIFPCDGSTTQVRVLQRVLRAQGIQGLIIAQAHESFTALPFSIEGFAAAYIGNGIHQPQLSRVDAALDYDLRLAWQQLRAQGRQRIGLITWSVLTEKTDGAWMGTYLHAQRKLPENNRLPPLELESLHDLRPIEAWIRQHRPDALLSERDDLFIHLKTTFPDLHLACLAIAHEKHACGIRIGRHAIGEAAVDMVVAQLNRGERGMPKIPKRVLIEGEWIAGL